MNDYNLDNIDLDGSNLDWDEPADLTRKITDRIPRNRISPSVERQDVQRSQFYPEGSTSQHSGSSGDFHRGSLNHFIDNLGNTLNVSKDREEMASSRKKSYDKFAPQFSPRQRSMDRAYQVSPDQQRDSHLESGSPQQYMYRPTRKDNSDKAYEKDEEFYGYKSNDSIDIMHDPFYSPHEYDTMANRKRSDNNNTFLRNESDRRHSRVIITDLAVSRDQNKAKSSFTSHNSSKLGSTKLNSKENDDEYDYYSVTDTNSESSEDLSQNTQSFLKNLLRDDPKSLKSILPSETPRIKKKDESLQLVNQILERYSSNNRDIESSEISSSSSFHEDKKPQRFMTLDERRSAWKEQASSRQSQAKMEVDQVSSTREELNKLFDAINERIQPKNTQKAETPKKSSKVENTTPQSIQKSSTTSEDITLNDNELNLERESPSVARYQSPTKSSSMRNLLIHQDRENQLHKENVAEKNIPLNHISPGAPRQTTEISFTTASKNDIRRRRDFDSQAKTSVRSPNSNEKIIIKATLESRERQRSIQMQQNRERDELKDTLARLSRIACSKDTSPVERKVALERMSLLEELIVRRVKDRLGENEYSESTSLISPRTSKPTRSQNVPITAVSPRLTSPIRGSPGMPSPRSPRMGSPRMNSPRINRSSERNGGASPRISSPRLRSPTRTQTNSPRTPSSRISSPRTPGVISPQKAGQLRSPSIASPRRRQINSPRLSSPTRFSPSPHQKMTSPRKSTSSGASRPNLSSPRRNAQATVSSIKERYEQRNRDINSSSSLEGKSSLSKSPNNSPSPTQPRSSSPKPRLMEYEEKQAQEKILSKRASLHRKQLLEKLVSIHESKTETKVEAVTKQSMSPHEETNQDEMVEEEPQSRQSLSPSMTKTKAPLTRTPNRVKSPPLVGFGSSRSRFV